jgi:hypothetical protein
LTTEFECLQHVKYGGDNTGGDNASTDDVLFVSEAIVQRRHRAEVRDDQQHLAEHLASQTARAEELDRY